jgi:hypothetical protein
MERLALADRRALGLRFGEPCDPRTLIQLYDVDRILESEDDYADYFNLSPEEVAELCSGLDSFSAVTLATPGANWIMLVNPAHKRRRATIDIAHEFGHLVRGHHPSWVSTDGTDLRRRIRSEEQETEAHAFGLALLLPYAPLLQLLDAGAPRMAIADYFGVTTETLDMRLKLAGLWMS